MPRGGARVGAGRKPKEPRGTRITRRSDAITTNAAPVATPATETPGLRSIEGGRAKEVSRTPPKDLPDDQREFWKRNAPLAIGAGTLTNQTEPSFRLMCELDAETRATKETLDKDGRTYIKVTVDGAGQEHQELKAHPLTSSYRQLAQRVEAMMARFGLAPFGKPVAGAGGKKKTTVSPWAAIVNTKR